MERILITGANGNVGQQVLSHFKPRPHQELLLASRAKSGLAANERYFDFYDPAGSAAALQDIDVVFLLRPPQISDVSKYFEPLLLAAAEAGVRHIVFLSVQGAEQVSFIPHAKIEKLIVNSGVAYTFIRPSYFMQNLTTTLLPDIRDRNQIVLPAGKAGFLWVDVEDIGRAIASVLQDVSGHTNKAYTITGTEVLNFYQVAALLSEELRQKITFVNKSPIAFYLDQRKSGVPGGFILVIILLHFLPRFQKPPVVSDDVAMLTATEPATLRSFIQRNKELFGLLPGTLKP